MGQQNSTTGFRVLQVKPNSPADEAGLESYFDFILEINQKPILNAQQFQNQGSKIECLVYSHKDKQKRTLFLYPRVWKTEKDGKLGCSVSFCCFNDAFSCCFHVLKVNKDSPAEKAGLEPNTDYIVGATQSIKEHTDLYALIAECASQSLQLRLLIYSTKTQSIRDMILFPTTEGLIGAELAYGPLHAIPTKLELAQQTELPI